ncbi:MAG TPA: signal peptidase II [Gammaproteobacteria bacterium]
MRTPRSLGYYALALLLVVADQVTKLWAEAALAYAAPLPLLPSLNLTLVYNTGAAFSFLADAGGWQRGFFIVVSSVVSAVLLAWLWRLPRGQRLTGTALALVLGGAVGNLVDRVAYGHVIDFVDVYYGDWHWPAFNLADSAISVGVVLLLLDGLRPAPRRA